MMVGGETGRRASQRRQTWQMAVGGNDLRKEYVENHSPAYLLNVLVLEFKHQNMETDKRYLVDVEKLYNPNSNPKV